MAVIRRASVTCDVERCEERFDDDRFGAAGGQVRRRALAAGWHTSGGKDVGPDCWDAGYRYGRDGWTVG